MSDFRRAVADRLTGLGMRPEREAEIVEELTQHLDDAVREMTAAGVEPAEARAAALAGLDAPGELARHLAGIEVRPARALPPPGAPSSGWWLSTLWLDLRHASRSLRRAPVFTASVVLTMALTIGPTTAMLSIGEWLLWRPVPHASDPARLGIVYFGQWREDGHGVSPRRVSPQNIADILSASTSIQALAGAQEGTSSVMIEGRVPDPAGTAHADANFFDVLGVRPAAGRFYAPEEDLLPYGSDVAVVSDGLARRAFGSPEGALGRTIRLNGRRLEVIGVAPRGFRGITPFSAVDVWYPGASYRRMHHFSSIPEPTRRDGTFYSFVVRLRPDATFDAAQAELDGLVAALAERHPDENTPFQTVRARVFAGLGPDVLQRDTYRTLVQRLVLIGAILVVIGCANVANLLIFRSARREREHGVRLALGAGRARLLQLQLTESCVLAIAGATLGVGLAMLVTRLVVALALPNVAGTGAELTVPIDARVLVATLGLSVAAGIAAGLLPAWMTARREASRALAGSGGRHTPAGRRVRTGFASVQLAFSLALLVNALLMVTTVRGLSAVDPGFVADGVTVHRIDLGSLGYTPARALQFVRELETGLSGIPAVTAVSVSMSYPPVSMFIQQVQPADGGPVDVRTNHVSASYFRAAGIPILRGRAFTVEEAFASGDAAGDATVISRSLAERLFGEADPLGETVSVLSGRTERTLRVVGVAGDVRTNLVTGEAELSLYEPFARGEFFVTRPSVLIKSAVATRTATDLIQTAAARIDPAVPVAFNQPLRVTLDRQLSDQRVFAWVLSLLGGFGFLLAAVGVYGLLAQAVTERTREFGIRLAVGATPGRVFRLVLGHASLVAGAGAIAGLGLGRLGSRLIEAQFWGVSAHQAWIYGGTAFALVCVVFLAAAWPARTAMRIDPVDVVRAE